MMNRPLTVTHEDTSPVATEPSASQEPVSAVEPAAPIDRTALLASVGGNETLLREVVAVFLEDTPKQMAALETAVRAHNAQAIAAAAHALKGSAGLFSKAGAYDAARRLEQAARQGDLTGIATASEEVKRQVAALEEGLRRLLPP